MSLADKLHIKPNQAVAVYHLPEEVDLELPENCTVTAVPAAADAVIVFATNRTELDERAQPAIDAALRDALAWIAYPKGGQLGTDLNRDSLWETLSERQIRPVRQVAIDEVWSALRFRPDR